MSEPHANETGAHTNTGAGAATAQARAEKSWDEAKAELNPYEQRLANFLNRRISAQPNVTVNVRGHGAEALEYLPGGDGFGRMKVQMGVQSEPEVVDVDEILFETLLAKIITV